MLKALMDRLNSNANRMKGRTDLLEAVTAGAALITAADGDIDDKEIEATMIAVKSNPALTGAFKTSEIEKSIDTMLARAQGGRAGRSGLYKEIRDIADAEKEDRELVLLTAMDIADADGNTCDPEQKVIDKIASELSLKVADYDI